ncbi:unnamed protein product [Hymenolepis diminuta]|uniref:Reverse transcriptase domain-containing protein n=1 Tax=Hymenolepis diminuta TaxID=6216 RepID=A0A564Z3U1_HYMDI|nr:unnamed protein product [Hymenolepis diminuta]
MEVEEIIFACITVGTVLQHTTVYHSVNFKLTREMSQPGSSDGISEISVLPPTSADRTSTNHSLILAAANGSPIETFGQKSVALDLGHILDPGIIRRSSSNWSSALSLIPKKSGDWRPCGDYRALNSIRVPDNYLIPNVQDFSSNLRNEKIFSKFDLVRPYNQIPLATADISKTAIATPFGLFEFP